MKRQSGYGGFPAILLTFSLLLLVLAFGFVLGRVVVARAYLDKAPRFDARTANAPEVVSGTGRERSAVPGRVYVPPPAPPPKTPGEEEGGAEVSGQASGSVSEPGPAEGAGARAGEARTTTDAPAPAQPTESRPREAVREPQPVPQPRGGPPAPEQAEEHSYSIQVGVFTSRQGARKVVEELARAGYPARIGPEKRGSQDLYRVLTGRYRSEYAARKAVEQLRKEGFEAFLIQE
ncbi:MAG TPA: SPOR domain-containing protein [Armatimonadota bacterium]|nr:SPOR domain-containing protein [Armatimonadota bacterium]